MQAQSQSQSRHLRKDEVIQNQERKGQPNYLGQGHVAVISRLRWLHIFFSVPTGKEFVSNWIGVKHAFQSLWWDYVLNKTNAKTGEIWNDGIGEQERVTKKRCWIPRQLLQ